MKIVIACLTFAMSLGPVGSALAGNAGPPAADGLEAAVAGMMAEAPAATHGSRPCTARKVEAGGTYMKSVLACHGAAAGRGMPVSADCLRQAAQKLDASFAKLDRSRQCEATTGGSDQVVSRIDPSVAELVAALDGPRPSRCAQHRLTAMAMDAKQQHSCQADAVAKDPARPVDPACQATVTGRFVAAFGRVARYADCGLGTVDVAAIGREIEATAGGVRGTISPAMTTCAAVEVAAFHGTSFLGNARLAKIENGHVPCVQMDQGTPASCAFSTTGGQQSGEWLESPAGNFALVGQALALNGTPGGEYVVAARITNTAAAACVEPTGMDTAGRVAEGMDLAEACVVEEILSNWNALAYFGNFPLENYTDLEVCSTDRSHPDDARFVRSYPWSGTGPDDVFCYTGRGAALNDLNGHERDENAQYYNDTTHCHLLQSSGYEVPGAKRPATRSLPAPGSVNVRSPIQWRPVSSNFNIANGGGLPALQTFTDREAFIADTGAISASGDLPDLGQVADRVTIGSITLSLALGANTIFVGASGTGAEPDWYPLLPGNDIALGVESLQVQTAAPVYALGFDFAEPDATMPSYGGTPVDSTFDVVLYSGSTEVGRTSFNADDDVAAFVGIWSERSFDRATIVDRTGNADDEFFGSFYTGLLPKP